MENILRQLLSDFALWLAGIIPSLVTGIVIGTFGWFFSKWVERFIDKTAEHLGWDQIVWSYISTVVRYVLVVIFFVAALKQAGFPVESLLAAMGISGLIIGMEARRGVANYFAGVMMLAARPFKQGDLIEFGPPPQVGRVTEVQMSYTGIVTLDNVRIVVPNSVIWRNKIINYSRYDSRAAQIRITIPYDVDVDWVADIALDVLNRHEAVQNEPAPNFTVSDVADENVTGLLVAWSAVQTMNIFGDVITEMRKEFEAAELEVIVPAKDIDLKREE